MDGSGTITWETFLENAESFLRVSDKLLDGWTFHGEKDVPGQAYLARQAKIFIPIDDGMVNSAEATDDWCEELGSVLQEDPFVGASSPESPLITEHHILWSLSYSVPVLYFNAWKSDFSGMNVVSVEEVQKYLHHLDLKYTELSQAIHPIVGTPFLFLHPCMSHELLRNTAKSKNQLVSWLSSVAPAAFHLNLNTEYYKLT
ncbi:ubiquitin-like-conjugating enzyme ATG10 isoform X2 [Prorops nasuta]